MSLPFTEGTYRTDFGTIGFQIFKPHEEIFHAADYEKEVIALSEKLHKCGYSLKHITAERICCPTCRRPL